MLSVEWTERWIDGQMKGRKERERRKHLWVAGQMVGGGQAAG